MHVIERSHTVVGYITRRFTAAALACLPALILVLSAAPNGCPNGCGDELTPPTVSVVQTLP